MPSQVGTFGDTTYEVAVLAADIGNSFTGERKLKTKASGAKAFKMKEQQGKERPLINTESVRLGSGLGTNERVSFAFYLTVLAVGLFFTFGAIVCVLTGKLVAGSSVCVINFGMLKYFYVRLETINRQEREAATGEKRLRMAFSEVDKIANESVRDQARRDIIEACIKVNFDPNKLRPSMA